MDTSHTPSLILPSKDVVTHSKGSHIIEMLHSNPSTGLSESDLTIRQSRFGKNILPSEKSTPLFLIFLRQFTGPFIYVLLIAAVCSSLLGRMKDATMIFLILLTNGLLGTFQEYGAEKKATALKSFLKLKTITIRESITTEIDAEELVPGDIVTLQSGDRVPADIKIIEATGLSVDESFLTGESNAVDKYAGENENSILFAGSTILAGRAKGVVYQTGAHSLIGSIATNVSQSKRAKPPLLIRMESFSKIVSIAILVIVILLSIVSFSQGSSLEDTFFIAIGLAVAAIPEGLPIAVTIALAIASQRMAKRGVIIKQLAAVEALGSCTMIATDKTGTLTVNKQTVKTAVIVAKERLEIEGEGYNDQGAITFQHKPVEGAQQEALQTLAEAALFSNEGTLYRQEDEWKFSGDSVDIALLAFAYKAGLSYREKEDLTTLHFTPYESEKRYSAVYYQKNDSYGVAIKGALETILPLCSQMFTTEGIGEIDARLLEKEATALAEQGFRVIALAGTESGTALPIDSDETLLKTDSLTFYGLLGLIDPIHPAAFGAVAECKTAGIEVAMITGDHPATAFAIAKDLRIASKWEEVITGKELEELKNKAIPDNIRVFARVSPLQKYQIVEHFKKQGHYVAVTGDGVNDAPALKSAHIGVAMGNATDVAKDAASIVLKNNNFDTIVSGIEEGRIAYDNIRKVIFLLIPTAGALLLVFSLSLFAGLPVVFFPLQLLWINMVTNGIQDIGLAFEKGEKNIMKRPPRNPKESIFDHYMIYGSLVIGVLIGLGTFGAWKYLLHAGYDENTARNIVLLLLVLFQNFHVLNARSENSSFLHVPIKNNYMVMGGIVLAFMLHITALHWAPLQDLLGTMPVGLDEFSIVLLLASTVLIVMEVYKYLRRRKLISS